MKLYAMSVSFEHTFIAFIYVYIYFPFRYFNHSSAFLGLSLIFITLVQQTDFIFKAI